jgi:hypothetical protein
MSEFMIDLCLNQNPSQVLPITAESDAFTRDEADRFRPAVGSRDDLMLVKGEFGRAAEHC